MAGSRDMALETWGWPTAVVEQGPLPAHCDPVRDPQHAWSANGYFDLCFRVALVR